MALAFLCIVSSLASLSEDGCQIWTSVDRKDFNKTFVDASDPLANIIRPYGYKALIYEKAQISNDIHQLLKMLNRILKFSVTYDIIMSAINVSQNLFLS